MFKTFIACAPIYSILAIELTLKWNNVSNVYTVNSTGQLIPFVIGVAGFLKVFYDIRGKFNVRTCTVSLEDFLKYSPIIRAAKKARKENRGTRSWNE